MEKTRVLIFLPSFAGGGAERTIVNLLRHYDQSKLEIRVCLLSGTGAYVSAIPGDQIFIHKKGQNLFDRSWLFQAYFFLFRLIPFQKKVLKTFKPDILLTVTESMNYLGFFWSMKSISSEFKWIVRSGNNIFSEANSKGTLVGGILNRLLRKTYRKADHILVISEGIKTALCNKFQIPASQITTIYNPIDVSHISQLAQTHPNPPIEKPYVLGIGRLAKQKRFDVMISSFAKSGLHQHGYQLIILGEGPEKQSLEKLIRKLYVSSVVTLHGFEDNPYYFLRHAKTFLLTSEWEGFAHVVAEALACDTPVIATNCEFGPSEILDEEKYGKIVPVNDVEAISGELSKLNATNSIEASENRKLRAKRFDVSKIIPEYEKLFIDLSTN